MNKLLPVDSDYLLLDYYYFIVWRASCTKRVKRDYFYLDYSFLGSAWLLILSSMRSFQAIWDLEIWARRGHHRSPSDYSFPGSWGDIGVQRWRSWCKKAWFSLEKQRFCNVDGFETSAFPTPSDYFYFVSFHALWVIFCSLRDYRLFLFRFFVFLVLHFGRFWLFSQIVGTRLLRY